MPSFEFLGPYRIGKPLGHGGMGSVYAAVHEKTGERVAVKLIAQHVSEEMKFRRRFDREIKTLQRLRHSGIVRIVGIGEEDGQLFYSMELVEGESLQARIRREKRLDWRPTLDMAIQICAALKHAHDIGVVHRDLKPANLMLTENDEIKLVDFGIAKIFGEGEQTLPGSVLGTADYMAPEQATGSGVTARTDLYALGNVMYAMLTGRPPFTGKKVTEVIESVKRDRPVPLDLVNPEIPQAIVDLVHDLLEKAPEDRPPTALAVMNRLKSMRAGLQREQTVNSEKLATEVALADPDSHDTSVTGLSDSDLITDVARDKNAMDRKKTIVSKGSDAKQRQIDPQAATVVSDVASEKTIRPDGSVAAEDDPDRRHTKSHFQTVTEALTTSEVFRGSETPTTSVWRQWLGIAAMVGVLLAGGALFIYALQPPSADELYDAAVAGDTRAARTFLRRFRGDDRFAEIYNIVMDTRLTALIKRLKTQAKLQITPLEPSEEGFLLALEDRELEPLQSKEKLDDWLTLYGDAINARDPNFADLIELAKHERDQLQRRAPRIIVDRGAQELLDEIDRIVAEESPDVARKKLTSMINIHGTHGWASPAVDAAKKQLELLDESPSTEPASAATE